MLPTEIGSGRVDRVITWAFRLGFCLVGALTVYILAHGG
jgi:hypothetical protein